MTSGVKILMTKKKRPPTQTRPPPQKPESWQFAKKKQTNKQANKQTSKQTRRSPRSFREKTTNMLWLEMTQTQWNHEICRVTPALIRMAFFHHEPICPSQGMLRRVLGWLGRNTPSSDAWWFKTCLFHHTRTRDSFQCRKTQKQYNMI